jgi:hypothetical protein
VRGNSVTPAEAGGPAEVDAGASSRWDPSLRWGDGDGVIAAPGATVGEPSWARGRAHPPLNPLPVREGK